MAPWGPKAILSLVLFPRPSRWFGPGSHSLCLAAILYATKTPQLYQSKRDGQKEHSASLKDEGSVFCDLIIYFLVISQFVVSVSSSS